MSVAIDLTGRWALVTGGSRGIGKAVVEVLVESGCHVAFTYRKEEAQAAKMCTELATPTTQVAAFACDFSEDGAAQALVETVHEHCGTMDILVANAGIWEGAPLEDLTPESLNRTFKINVEGVIQTVRHVANGMRAARSGRIVVIGSTAGQRGEANYSQYAASKGAVHLFVKSVAVELAPHGINVNTVAPGWVKTDMVDSAMVDGGEEEISRLIPRGCVALPKDVAGAVLFLCSSLSDHMVGATLNVNGGSVLD